MSPSSAPIQKYLHHTSISTIKEWLKTPNGNLYLKGLTGSSVSLIAATLKDNASHIIVADDKESAAYLYHDLTQLLGETPVFFLPSSYKRSPEYGQPESSQIILRTEALQNLRNQSAGQFFVTYPEALMEKVPDSETISNQTITVKKGENTDLFFVVDFLNELGFQRTDFVYEPGYYSVRGSILDVFSYSHEEPYRIDFFGDEIESIRSFDIENQLSKTTFEEITIVPKLSSAASDQFISINEYIPQAVKFWMNSPSLIYNKMDEIYQKVKSASYKDENHEENRYLPGEKDLINGKLFMEQLTGRPFIIWGNPQKTPTVSTIQFNTSPQPLFHKKFSLIEENMRTMIEDGYRIMVLSDNKRQFERLTQIFSDRGSNLEYEEMHHALHEGFIDHDLKLCIYTDHQIFDRYHKFTLKTDKTRAARQSITLKELTRLNPGDYVVHVDHGIGKFGGLVTMQENGKKQEAIQLIYRDNDVLLVNIHSLHRISKYKGQEGEPPRVNKLGTAAWSKMKEKTKKKVKDIARELIALYARRKSEPGYGFSADSFMQNELEASFIYEDTPDQIKATQAVKQDMEEHNPMDRLVCGDVGFGKTEVAIRAALKAVADNKQVAVLVPTTILAFQHYHTFRDRLKDFPCRVEYISRLRKASETKSIIKDTSEGKVDILIGTHRLVGKDINFKDLGLLIIDEEQRFGVSVKEKLKRLKTNVDTLTLTATPIPRTLQFSLMGARDLSILNTPPANRHPIFTELHTFDADIIKEAIQHEVERNGQVFFINNRVQNIHEIEHFVNRLLPNIKTVVAHGQMEGSKLEKIMLEFIDGEHDVLIATTIIESGLDIPNANTIIINNAHQFGLSELHQLRGRVGRSNKKAFCYLLAPPVTTLTNDARRRLKILEEFSDLGSGFQIAMQDLDIRGAGNLLGGEQSGFIADIGYETYQRILEEALLELRETEYPETLKQSESLQKNMKYVTDCQIETDADIRLPEEYVSNIAERMNLYRELDNIKEIEKIEAFRKNTEDRFGELPKEAEGLLLVVKMRILAESLGMEKISYKNNTVRVNFVSNQSSPFYQSGTFGQILLWLQSNHKKAKMEEKNGKLWLIVSKVASITDAYQLIEDIRTTQQS
ncbi:transcription-repair coupling factor [Natronoflexus pectinivorans]|uniref:Transcription-repair-coupling factor n=1 Tax=Natronoflexus pectinivorans TaxID=682526 RepID=A0A4R2GAV6_9BACT|nr:transcription-repair coupling factor [Natronoflexus pectinivorans]TCO04940.1 transcription-repair coupling factor (superfamily II helicase) [Natronoflexus pectinivorans]